MYEMLVDFKKCKGCLKCEVLLPTFRHVHGGRLLISKRTLEDEEIRAAADRIKDACPEGAIIFRAFK